MAVADLSFLLLFLNTRGLVVGVGRENDGAFHNGSDGQVFLKKSQTVRFEKPYAD
jgi:hypothetical protein